MRAKAIVVLIALLMSSLISANGFVAAVNNFSDAELDELFSPIALYPDPLLAQVVPAATFVDQLEQAQRVLNGGSDDNLISQQDWDVSVKSVAHYPQVLKMMVDKHDWTTAVGQAYVNQSTDVGKSIQRLRAEAKAAGSLVTTPQQQVVVEGNTIKIVPAQAQVIYVPQYNPEVVYVDSGPSTGDVIVASAISFGVGMAIGAWLNNDWDWYGRGIYYHGWVGGGWVSVNRTFINVNRNVYINNRYRNVNVNRNITNRDINNYRTTLNRDATVRQQNISRNRNNINRDNVRESPNSASRGGGNRSQVRQDRDRGSSSIRRNTDRSSGVRSSSGNRSSGGGRKSNRGGGRKRH